jgi:hypothetical protein
MLSAEQIVKELQREDRRFRDPEIVEYALYRVQTLIDCVEHETSREVLVEAISTDEGWEALADRIVSCFEDEDINSRGEFGLGGDWWKG